MKKKSKEENTNDREKKIVATAPSNGAMRCGNRFAGKWWLLRRDYTRSLFLELRLLKIRVNERT